MTSFSPPPRTWFPTVSQPLLLSSLATDYPVLARLHDVWRTTHGNPEGRKDSPQLLPAKLDLLELPRRLLPYVVLLDLERAPHPRLRVRQAGTYICEKYGHELRGLTTDDVFAPEDARFVVASALQAADNRLPSLARREYVTMSGALWRYTRLILPMSRDGRIVDGFFKALDPASLTRLGSSVAA